MRRYALRHKETGKYQHMRRNSYRPNTYHWYDKPTKFYNRPQDAVLMLERMGDEFEIVTFELREIPNDFMGD